MGMIRDALCRVDIGGLLPLLLDLNQAAFNGAVRVRNGSVIAGIWLVKGQIVHAVCIEGQKQITGPEALETIGMWTSGSYFIERNVLPPERTVRADMPEILAALRIQLVPAATERLEELSEECGDEELETVFDTLRVRVPGLESLSLSSGAMLKATTARDTGERDWLNRQLQTCCQEDLSQSEKLFCSRATIRC